LDEAQIKPLVALLPREWHPDPRRRERRSVEEIVAQVADPRHKEIIRQAFSLLGQPDHLSVHPGGLVITPGPLTDVVPVQWAPKGFLITQFDHQDAEALGLPKLDLLGISALTVIADTAELIQRRHGIRFNPAEIPLDDPQTGELLARADTIGVFQCESEGARKTLRQLRASSVRDLAVANAFFKPGPAMGGMARQFVRRYRGEEAVSFLHPALAPILGSTQGVLLFQEQILRLATEIAGLSWEQADHLRRGMSKFQAEEMTRMRQAFIQGCQRPTPDGPAFNLKQAETLWEQVAPFSGYGFNQGHATAYADVSYRLAYLKAYWPAELLCTRLATPGGFHHQAIYLAEAVRLGIAVRPPHLNHSRADFTLSPEQAPNILWMGLGQVRDLRREAIKAIIAARRQQPFTSLQDLLGRVALQPKEVTHLIQGGALDGLGDSRSAMLAELAGMGRAGSALQLAFSFDRPAVPPEAPAQRLAWERFVLGLPVSVQPLETVPAHPSQTVPLAGLPGLAGQPVLVAGYRLPGWTGGEGFYLGDGQTFVLARGAESLKAPPWQPVLAQGRWLSDAFGTAWLQVEQLTKMVDEG
jgi:DNA polymerase III alpha subunit